MFTGWFKSQLLINPIGMVQPSGRSDVWWLGQDFVDPSAGWLHLVVGYNWWYVPRTKWYGMGMINRYPTGMVRLSPTTAMYRCWVALFAKLPRHVPGGAKLITDAAGMDATAIFDPIHPKVHCSWQVLAGNHGFCLLHLLSNIGHPLSAMNQHQPSITWVKRGQPLWGFGQIARGRWELPSRKAVDSSGSNPIDSSPLKGARWVCTKL